MQTAIAASTGEFVHFIQFAFSTSTLRYSTGSQTMTWDGQTWTAIGGRLEVPAIPETPDLAGGELTLNLSGVAQAFLAVLLSEQYIGRAIKVWLVHLNTTAGTVIADPVLLFSGFMNGGWSISENADEFGHSLGTVDITGRCASRLAQLDIRKGVRANMASHQSFYRGDRLFEYVPSLATQSVIWSR
jgi:hypothetical protein